nr:unnamed protein product [Callosobruchus chinensis]
MSSKTLRTIGTSKPIRMWIDGKCFDVKQQKIHPSKTTQRTISGNKKDESCHAETSEDNYSNSQNLSLAEILKDDKGKISTSFELPPYVHT